MWVLGAGPPAYAKCFYWQKVAKVTWIYWKKVVTLQPKQWKKVADMLPPIVYGIIDIGKVFGNATFLRCFFKNNANPFQNRNIRSQALKGYTSELLRSLNTEQLLLKILQESSKIH